MILIFLSALLMVYSAQLFTFSFSIQGINRAIVSTPIELMQHTVSFSDDGVHFIKDKFELFVLTYYKNSLSRYVNDYSVDFYYYNLLDRSMCLSEDCSGVEITVECKLMLTQEYKRVMYYEIRGKK